MLIIKQPCQCFLVSSRSNYLSTWFTGKFSHIIVSSRVYYCSFLVIMGYLIISFFTRKPAFSVMIFIELPGIYCHKDPGNKLHLVSIKSL